jgi:hypothetical protein
MNTFKATAEDEASDSSPAALLHFKKQKHTAWPPHNPDEQIII